MNSTNLKIKLFVLLISVGLLAACKNRITEKPDALVLTDVLGNTLTIKGQANKEFLLSVFQECEIDQYKDLWFYIDRDFYIQMPYDTVKTKAEQISDSLALIWFSTDANDKELFLTEDPPIFVNKMWDLTDAYDEKYQQILYTENCYVSYHYFDGE